MKQQEMTCIDGFPRWGCYVASLASFAERHSQREGREFSPEEFKEIYAEAVGLGYVLHNDIPTDKSGWYRCFVVRPLGLGNLLLERSGLELRLDSMRRSNAPGPDFCLICYRTKWGFHFALGDAGGREVVNPDPGLPVLGVDSYRVFALGETL
ncbi:MAG: hypothetical protein AAF975_00030 [Spirochaetota bacterium]